MALTSVPTVASATSSKQIVITPSSSTSVLYTVPAGKTFTGIITIYQGAYPQINGVYLMTISTWGGGFAPFYYPLTLVAGSTIQNGSSSYPSWTLIGTEQ